MDSIGEILRRTREEKKIPIAQVSRDTKIRERYIVAIEEGEYSVLPAPTYSKGFLKIYAEYLGLDPRPIIEQFLREHIGVSKQAFSIEGDMLATDVATRSWRFTALGVGAAIVIIIVILSGVSLWKSCSSVSVQRSPRDTEELETLPLPPISSARPARKPAKDEAATGEVKGEKRKLEARARRDAWVKVLADDILIFQGTIPKGKKEFWLAKKKFHLRIGRPEAVELILDGKAIKNLEGASARNLIIDKDGNVTFYKGKMREE